MDPRIEEDYRRRLEEMSLSELVDAWEEPMPDPIRALLRTEFEARDYRVQSLPEPPPSAPHTSLQPLRRADQARGHAVMGTNILLAVAVLQLLTGAMLAWRVTEEPPEFLPVCQTLNAGSSTGLGVVFLLLYLWATVDPYRAMLAATTLFAALHGIETVRATLPPPSIGVSVFVLAALAMGTHGAHSLKPANEP